MSITEQMTTTRPTIADWPSVPVSSLTTLTPLMRRVLANKGIKTCGELLATAPAIYRQAAQMGDITIARMIGTTKAELRGNGYDLATNPEKMRQQQQTAQADQPLRVDYGITREAAARREKRKFMQDYVLARAAAGAAPMQDMRIIARAAEAAWDLIAKACEG